MSDHFCVVEPKYPTECAAAASVVLDALYTGDTCPGVYHAAWVLEGYVLGQEYPCPEPEPDPVDDEEDDEVIELEKKDLTKEDVVSALEVLSGKKVSALPDLENLPWKELMLWLLKFLFPDLVAKV